MAERIDPLNQSIDDLAMVDDDGTEDVISDIFHGLRVHKLHDDVPDIEYGTQSAACFDLRAYFHQETITIYDQFNLKTIVEGYERVALQPRERALIPTGMILDIPMGYSVRLHPRSGLAVKFGINLINCEGVVDSDYTNQLYVPLYNSTEEDFEIIHGDRIAQAEIVPVYIPTIEYIDDAPGQKGDRTGGFGSTGHK